jgi:hypothetical protein
MLDERGAILVKMETFELTADEGGEPGKEEGRPESHRNPGFRENVSLSITSIQIYSNITDDDPTDAL